jgi:hypothetical protein
MLAPRRIAWQGSREPAKTLGIALADCPTALDGADTKTLRGYRTGAGIPQGRRRRIELAGGRSLIPAAIHSPRRQERNLSCSALSFVGSHQSIILIRRANVPRTPKDARYARPGG